MFWKTRDEGQSFIFFRVSGSSDLMCFLLCQKVPKSDRKAEIAGLRAVAAKGLRFLTLDGTSTSLRDFRDAGTENNMRISIAAKGGAYTELHLDPFFALQSEFCMLNF